MRHTNHRILFAALILSCSSTWAQMHKVAKPEQVVRAIGVYEWTGDFAKPAASRLIPVSLFIDGKLEDAGIYVARPVPFALLSGNVYELQTAGIDKGYLDLSFARHLEATTSTGDLAFDDGWFGYGTVKPLAAPRKIAALKPSKTLPVLHSSASENAKPQSSTNSTTSTASNDDPDRPTMKRRSSDTSSPGTTTPSTTSPTTPTSSTTSDDPDRPTMKRRSDSSTTDSSSGTTTASTGSTPDDDPDRPIMKRKSDTSDSSTTGNTDTTSTPADDPNRPTMQRHTSDTSTPTDPASTTTSSTPSDDPDRPTLKRHSAEDAKRAHDTNSVVGTGALNDDPDRPNLHRGKPTSAMTDSDLPKLSGLPQNLHQMVAVSDAANRDPHPFTLEWDDPTQHAAVLEKMQTMARAQLTAYTSTPGTKAPAPTPTVKKTTTTTSTTHPHRTTTAPAPTPLLDEELKAYTLSYGGAATYIYSAHTAGTGADLRYVTIVAQDNGLGEIKPAIQNVTDAAHLDRTPHMRFVDVVDVEASNRASLLFELRGQNARQFGLYRVIAAHSEQIFLTGTTQ
ncbi:hypothetical protein RBB77_03720 [Tunturibacter psychrotolerans]|uniref:Uncharacterized protein n=1 Tax=Tunturiibacter psychrotolerans TaxID=3069686 RepID=A0AAU7ZSQ8_9BACT